MQGSKKHRLTMTAAFLSGVLILAVGAIVFALPRGLPSLFSSMVRVIGVYQLPGDQKSHVIEVMVEAPASDFDTSMFYQDTSGSGVDDRRAAYCEHYLSLDGTRSIGLESHSQITRLVFVIDDVDFNLPMITPFGPVTLTNPEPIPDRVRDVLSADGG